MAEYDKKLEDFKEKQAAKLEEARAAQTADHEANLEELKAEQAAKLEEMRTGQQNALDAKKGQMKELQAAKIWLQHVLCPWTLEKCRSRQKNRSWRRNAKL